MVTLQKLFEQRLQSLKNFEKESPQLLKDYYTIEVAFLLFQKEEFK